MKRQRNSTITEGVNVDPSPIIKFDQNVCLKILVKMLVKFEFPFRFVENEDFRDLLMYLQPRFDVP